MPRPAVAGTGPTTGKQEWNPPPSSSGRRDATDITPEVTSLRAFMYSLETLRVELRVSIAG